MGRKKLSMAEKVRRYLAAHPDAKPREIAQKLSIPVATVYAVKYTKAAPAAPAAPVLTIKVSDPLPEPKQEVKEEPVDIVNKPPHYTDGGIETIDFIEAKLSKEEFIGYLKGSAIKYASRIGKKDNPGIDAGKMLWYTIKLRDLLSSHT